MNIIENNPYRYMGVYFNSPIKDRIANQTKAMALLRVKKLVIFDLDLPNILPPIRRTIDGVSNAISKLVRPEEQIKYAQFWFVNITPLDNIAFNHLKKGDISKACYIWERKDNLSSIQNRIVIALIKQDYYAAIKLAENLYTNYASNFISYFDNIRFYNKKELAHRFLESLLEEGVNPVQLYEYINDKEWQDYITDKTITPIIDKIEQAISNAKLSNGKGSNARFVAGQELIESTKSLVVQLKKLVSLKDIRYTTIVDKLGLEILQCCIDYYNDSKDFDRARKTQQMHIYAQSIVAGEEAQKRCEKNRKVIDEAVSRMPPIETIKEYSHLMDELSKYNNLPKSISNTIEFLKKTYPILQKMKTILSESNDFYLKTSTLVVESALSDIIDKVNSVQKSADRPTILYTLECAWSATKYMDKFDKEATYKTKRYLTNRMTLLDICKHNGVSTSSLKSKLLRSVCIIGFFIVLGIILAHVIYGFDLIAYIFLASLIAILIIVVIFCVER